MNVLSVGRKIMVMGAAVMAVTTVANLATARIKPPMAMFVSVAGAAEYDPLAADNLRPSERAFLRQASQMARAEMRSAQLAVNHALSADVKAFAQQVVTDSQQISLSVEALARKKGVVLLDPSEAWTENFSKLSDLSSAEFDRAFVRMISDVQEETLKVYERALSDAKDTDVKDLAGSFLPTARDHLNKVRDLRKAFE